MGQILDQGASGVREGGDQPIEQLDPAQVVCDLGGHRGVRRVRLLAVGRAEPASLRFGELGRPCREEGATQDPGFVSRELDREPCQWTDRGLIVPPICSIFARSSSYVIGSASA